MYLKYLLPVFFFATSAATTSQSQTPDPALRSAQTVFQAHQDAVGFPVQRPVTVPRAVLQVLGKDSGVRSCLENKHLLPNQLPHSWFIGSLVHLNGQSQKDLLVVPNLSPDQSGCFHGIGSVAWFWVFRHTQTSYQLVLSVGAGTLRILDAESNGYSDIEISSWNATTETTTTFSFDGRQYREHKTKTEARH